MEKKINKVILAYSGGLDTSAMLLWIKETYGCEVVCYCADVGQGEELSGLEEKAKATGASTATVTRVGHWLRHGEGGYRLALDRRKRKLAKTA